MPPNRHLKTAPLPAIHRPLLSLRPLRLIFFAALLFVSSLPARAQGVPFGDGFFPTFTFAETYTDRVVLGDFGYEQVADGTLNLSIRVSMKDVVVEDLVADGNSLQFDVSNLQFSLDLFDAERPPDNDGDEIPDKVNGYEVYTWPLIATNPSTGEDIAAGQVQMRFNASELRITLSADHAPGTYSIYGTQQAGLDEEEIDVQQIVTVNVGPYALENVVMYISGSSRTFDKTVAAGTEDEQEFFGLADLSISGLIDAFAPEVKIVSPAVRDRVTENPAIIRGTCTDRFGVLSVEVQAFPGWERPPDDFPWTPAVVTGETWALGGVEYPAGRVRIRARAIDQNGLISEPVSRDITFSEESELTVSATGPAPGRVTSGFFAPVIYEPPAASPTSVTRHMAGKTLVVTAVPATGSVFDGWTSNKTLTPAQLAGAKITFQHEANMTLTARFIANPFIPVKGRYDGLATGATPAGNGFLSVTLAPNGTYTGSLKVGALSLKLKGKFSNDGRSTQTVRFRRVDYTIDLTLNVSGTGAGQITGTVKGGNVDVVIGAGRAIYDRRTNPAPQAGTYNVIIPPAAGQGSDYPVGFGIGRIVVSPSGAARFTGRTGTTPTFNAAARLSADGTWPFFGSLYTKRGSISGVIVFDLANSAHDLTGTLAWFKPAGVTNIPVHTAGFVGQSTLIGAKYTPALAGERVFLVGSGGAGRLSISAPADGAHPALAVTFDATLGTDHKLTAVALGTDPISEVKAAFSPFTGQFVGSFVEGGVVTKFAGIAVDSKLNRGAGFFRRGTSTGAIEIVAP